MFGSSRPAWSGIMQLVHHGRHPGKSSVMFLTMIDMNPNDITCVYFTLKYVQDPAHHHRVIPIITFKQPLWSKALMIIVTEPVGSDLRNVVLSEMSFLGCISHLMAASGLQELLELIYSSNAVVHMLTGKGIARTVRGHFIVDAALNALILASTFDVPIPISDEETEVLKYAATYSFCMQSLYVTLPHTSMELEREILSRSSNRVDTLKNKPRCLLQSQLHPRKIGHPENH